MMVKLTQGSQTQINERSALGRIKQHSHYHSTVFSTNLLIPSTALSKLGSLIAEVFGVGMDFAVSPRSAPEAELPHPIYTRNYRIAKHF